MKQYTFLATRQNFKGKAFEITDHEAIQAYIDANRETDTYKTINLYKEPTERKKDNVGYLISLVIDVEATGHAFDITLEDAKQLTDHIKQDFDKIIPTPSKINHSGRGLHIYFDIHPTTDRFKYQLVLSHIQQLTDQVIAKYDALTEARHDPKVDYYSLIRVEGTKNTKAGTYVSTIYYNLKRYTLDELIEGYIKPLEHIKGNNTEAIEQAHQAHFKTFTRHFKGYNANYTKQTLRQGILDDLKTLQTIRNDHITQANGVYRYIGNEGNRNYLLFYFGLYANYLYNDTKRVYEAMKEFNANFKPQPLPSAELEATYKSITSNSYATPRTATIIRNTGITTHEMQHLKIIMDAQEKRNRNLNKIRHKRNSDRKAIEKRNAIEQAKILHDQGKTYREIARVLGVALGTVHNYLKK